MGLHSKRYPNIRAEGCHASATAFRRNVLNDIQIYVNFVLSPARGGFDVLLVCNQNIRNFFQKSGREAGFLKKIAGPGKRDERGGKKKSGWQEGGKKIKGGKKNSGRREGGTKKVVKKNSGPRVVKKNKRVVKKIADPGVVKKNKRVVKKNKRPPEGW